MSGPILVTSGLSKSFQSSRGLFKKPLTVQAINNISFTLGQAETLSVVGETGSGRTTLAHILAGINYPDQGMLLYKGKPVSYLQKKDEELLHKKLRLIFQNPGRTLNPKAPVYKTLIEPLHNNPDVPQHEYRKRINQILEKVGLRPEQSHWLPHMFSGGQRQRIAIARALVSSPEIIIADEPLSALDVSVQAQIINLMLDLQQKEGVSYVFISHNLGVVQHISDKVLVMFGGQLMEYGHIDDVFNRPGHPYTRALLASVPGLKRNALKQWRQTQKILTKSIDNHLGCPYVSRCPVATEQCHHENPEHTPVDQQIVSCHHAGNI